VNSPKKSCVKRNLKLCREGKYIRNPLTPNDHYRGRTAPLTSKLCILYIYSTNICTEYFKHGIYSPIFHLQNAVCFINITYLVPVLFTFYIENGQNLKNNSGAMLGPIRTYCDTSPHYLCLFFVNLTVSEVKRIHCIGTLGCHSIVYIYRCFPSSYLTFVDKFLKFTKIFFFI